MIVWGRPSIWLPGRGAGPSDASILLCLAVGSAVTGFGLWETFVRPPAGTGEASARVLVSVLMGVASGVAPRLPGLSLAALWIASICQLAAGIDIMYVQFSFAVVLFACARYGRIATLYSALASIPVALLIGELYVRHRGTEIATALGISRIAEVNSRPSVIIATIAVLALSFPWLAGLTMRMSDQARLAGRSEMVANAERAAAETRRDQAERIAQLRAQQAQLANDVHDVVGHSLAAILAQADAATVLPDAEIAQIRAIAANIAASARSSLGDVSAVLSSSGAEAQPRQAVLEQLVHRTAESAANIRVTVTGRACPLTAEIDSAAERVLQELLTNAVKHGDPRVVTSLTVEWGDHLRLTTSNTIGVRGAGTGQGLAGVRRRLETVGGTVDVSRRGDRFVVAASIPLLGEEDEPAVTCG